MTLRDASLYDLVDNFQEYRECAVKCALIIAEQLRKIIRDNPDLGEYVFFDNKKIIAERDVTIYKVGKNGLELEAVLHDDPNVIYFVDELIDCPKHVKKFLLRLHKLLEKCRRKAMVLGS